MDSGRNREDLPRLSMGQTRVVNGSRRRGAKASWDARRFLRERAGATGRRGVRRTGDPLPTITVQAGICAVILVGILVVKTLDVPESREAFSDFNAALTSDSDMDKALGKLRFVTDLFDSSEAVFNPAETGMVLPVEELTMETGTTGQYVMTVEVEEDTPVLAAADGQVYYAGGSNEYGQIVRIRHQNGYETVYAGLTPEVKTGRTLLAGERIGVAGSGTEFRFMVYLDGVLVDPRPYFEKRDDS